MGGYLNAHFAIAGQQNGSNNALWGGQRTPGPIRISALSSHRWSLLVDDIWVRCPLNEVLVDPHAIVFQSAVDLVTLSNVVDFRAQLILSFDPNDAELTYTLNQP